MCFGAFCIIVCRFQHIATGMLMSARTIAAIGKDILEFLYSN